MEYYHVDLDEWLGARRYGDLLGLILQLPDPYSRFRSALNDDKELFLMIFGEPEDTTTSGGSLPYRLIGTTEHLLLNLQDRVDALISLSSAQLSKKKPKNIKPQARPKSMHQRIEDQRDEKEAQDFYKDLGFDID